MTYYSSPEQKKKERKKKEFKGVGLTLQALEDLVFFLLSHACGPCIFGSGASPFSVVFSSLIF